MDGLINESNIESRCRELAAIDPRLGAVHERYGTPPLWSREPTFETLIRIILEQQVSLASALSAFNKLKEKIGRVTPENVLSLTDSEMKAAYFSRQKMGYARNLAESVFEEKLRLEELHKLPDEEVRAHLMRVKGIGRWTSDIYLLMAMLRPDVMPKGDLALHSAWQKLGGLSKRPSSDEFVELAKRWKPLRSAAARLLWHFYLSERK